jgi:hypothetical protein
VGLHGHRVVDGHCSGIAWNQLLLQVKWQLTVGEYKVLGEMITDRKTEVLGDEPVLLSHFMTNPIWAGIEPRPPCRGCSA